MCPPAGSDDDKTQLVTRQTSSDQDKTIIPNRGFNMPGLPAQPAKGQVIGDIQQHVRVAGQPRPNPGSGLGAQSAPGNMAPPPPPGQGETMFLVAQPGAKPGDPPFDPVVGWVTIVKGSGRGQSRPVFYGQNSIGRGHEHRIPLDFGDQRMSRETHAFIIYDEIDRKFYLRDGGRNNPIRHKGNIVMVPTELKDRDEFTIGDTTLTFVALCTASFDWLADSAEAGKKPGSTPAA